MTLPSLGRAGAPLIVKADRTVEVFDPTLLAGSLMRAGAGEHTAQKIAEKIRATLAPNTSSRQIYKRAFALLRREGRPVAARYALRRALFEFGPSGHPFEDFISRLFTVEGWEVETRKLIKGHCVTHEVDFYASHAGSNGHLAAELKYHNDPGYKTDLKVALYVKARFEDIFTCDPKERACPLDRGILVTNTKFTTEAIAFAECAGVELLGWHYPAHDNLFLRMCHAKVYPITALTTLSPTEKRLLVTDHLVSADQLLEDRSVLTRLGFSALRVGEIVAEAQELTDLPHPALSFAASEGVGVGV